MPNRKATSAPILLIIAGLLLLFALTAAGAWRDKSPTFDEPLHFMGAWIQTHYGDLRCDPEDPPLWRYYAMLGTSKSQLEIQTSGIFWDTMLTDRLAEGFFFKEVFFFTPANHAIDLLAQARLRMIVIGLALGAGIGWWAWRLNGSVAAAIATAAFCLDPNFLAHSPLVKNDVPISLAFLLFMIAVWFVGRRVSWFRLSALALAMGVALTVKFSGVLTIPLLILLLGFRVVLPEPWSCLKWNVATRVRRLAVAAGIVFLCALFSYGFIWACYQFRYAPGPDPNQLFDYAELSRIASRHEAFAANHAFELTGAELQQWNNHWKPGFLFRAVLWTGNHHFLPQTWVEGFLFTVGTAPGRDAFLLGTNSMNGRWYYFPIIIAVKTPLATLFALAIAIIYCSWRGGFRSQIWNIVSLLTFPIFYLAVAMNSDLNLGIRHILPIYPFFFIALGLAAASALRQFRKPAIVLISLILIGLALETFSAYPNFIPFFNAAAGGWRNGPNLLGDSNVDWGQDLPALAQWQREHPQYQLFLNYFGSADPRYYLIHYVNLPGSSAPDDQTADTSRPPVYALSANALHSPWLTPQAREFYIRLQSHPPIAVLGHCIYLYNPP